MTIFLSSDLHLGHTLAATERGFATVDDHDRAIMAGLRRRLRDGDDLFLLGDLAFAGWVPRVLQLASLPGRKHLVLGNHDRAHPMHPNGWKHLAVLGQVFASVQTAATIRHGGVEWLLSHFPYSGDHPGTEDRHPQWRLPDRGQPIFHGHTHAASRVSRSTAGTVQVHVGLDAWGLKPVTLHDAVSAAT